jgi:hypothetical protein
MKIKNLLFSTLILLVTACGPAVKDATKSGSYDATVLERVRLSYCGSDHKLVESEDGTNVSFQYLTQKTRIFGFSTNTGDSCAVTSDITKSIDTNSGTLTFEFKIHGTCVKNDSLWEAVVSEARGSAQYFVLKSLDTPNNGLQIDMDGSLSMSANFAKDYAHMRALTCQ